MKKISSVLVPVSITFGPIFMVISASAYGRTLIGAVALGAGLAWMFKILMRQQQEILRLGQLLASDNHEHE